MDSPLAHIEGNFHNVPSTLHYITYKWNIEKSYAGLMSLYYIWGGTIAEWSRSRHEDQKVEGSNTASPMVDSALYSLDGGREMSSSLTAKVILGSAERPGHLPGYHRCMAMPPKG